MGEKLSDWLKRRGWRQLAGKTLYSGEGEKFQKCEGSRGTLGYDAHGELWASPDCGWSGGVRPEDFNSDYAGYFVDEENATHEYVFGPAAKKLAKAIEQFNKGE